MDHKTSILAEAEKSWMNVFIKNTKIAYLAAVFILLWGIMGIMQIPKEAAPQIDYGIITVSTTYIGASAIDMDQLVTQEIENKIKGTEGIRKMTSTSGENISTVVLELEPDSDTNKVLNDIRSKVDQAKAKLPTDAEDPFIQSINSSDQSPIFTIHLSGTVHPVVLRDYAETLKNYLEQDSYVKSVSISGGTEREIFVDLDPVKLAQYNISAAEIIQTIRSTHQDSPIGNFSVDNFDYSLRFEGRHKKAEDIQDIPIRVSSSGNQTSIVKVSDIARVYELDKEIDSIERFIDSKDQQALSTIKLQVVKVNNSDIFKADPQVRNKTQEFVEKNFSEVNVYFTNELLENVRDSYDNVLSSGIQSIIIVIIILVLFIGTREGLIAGLVIPLTFLVTIAVTNTRGDTLNFMVNFSMILALGILVDTAIVIVEGMYEAIKQGFTPKEAAMISLHEFKAPLLSGTLTTLAVFIPLLVLPGIMGKYLSFIPISVSITLIASLLISLFLIPGIASGFLKSKDEEKATKTHWFFTRWLKQYHSWHHQKVDILAYKYKAFLTKKMHSRALRMIMMYSVIIFFFLSFLLPVKFIMFPSDDINYLQAEIELPEGAIKENTLEATLPVEKLLLRHPEVQYIETSVSGNKTAFFITLHEKELREAEGQMTSIELAEVLRKEFEQFANYDVRVQELQGGPPSEAPVAFRIILDSPDYLNTAKLVAKDFKNILASIPGTDNVRDDITNIPGEITFRILREEALRLKVAPESIAQAVRVAIDGVEAATITRSGREVDIRVRYEKSAMQTFDDISNIQLTNQEGKLISLSQLVSRNVNPGFSEVKRVQKKVTVTVASDLSKEGNALEITQAFKEKIADYNLPEGINIEDAGENAENQDLFVALLFGFIIAVFLIFTILVIQFNSYKQPFMILFTIVMSLIGVNIGLFITGTPRSLAFIIGVISLAGIVVNDAIILVDRINNLRKEFQNRSMEDIIAHAGMTRMQPIILTTLTTAAGIFPLIFVDTFWAGLAFTIIFGLTTATTLTLFVTPAMYYQFENELGFTLSPFPMIIGGIIVLFSLLSLNWIGIVIGLVIFAIGYWWFRKKYRQLKAVPVTQLHL